MRILLRHWPNQILLYSSFSMPGMESQHYSEIDKDSIKKVLTDAVYDRNLLMKLRLLLKEHNLISVFQLSDEEVIKQVEALIANGSCFIVDASPFKRVFARAAEKQAAAPVEAEEVRPEPARQEPERAEPEPEEEDTADHVAQAETLKAAAEDGTPFCEECEKAKRERANAA